MRIDAIPASIDGTEMISQEEQDELRRYYEAVGQMWSSGSEDPEAMASLRSQSERIKELEIRLMEGSNIGHFRNHGVRHLWVNCSDTACNCEAAMSLDGLPDDLVLADLKSTLRCAKCGREGVDVRPDWGILHIAEIPYEDGTIRFRFARKLSAEGTTRWIRDGRFCSYYPNGTLASEGMYVDDQEHGLWTEYHSNGEMAARGHYANGKEVSHWEFWSSDGSPEEGEDYPSAD